MKSELKLLVAFLLNLGFFIFEFIGGIFTGSVAIISDAVHDIGDAASIGLSFFLEKKSKKAPDRFYTYGYARYSVIGGAITTLILLCGSILVIYNAVLRIFNPVSINYNSMIIFAIIGVIVNLAAAFFTHDGHSVNEKAVNLHMLEDVLGWVVVLIGAIVMRFSNLYILDPLMSIGVAIFILFNAVSNFKEILSLLLEKIPHNVSVEEIRHHILEIDGVIDVHHIHIWSLDSDKIYATMHIVTNSDGGEIKKAVREELSEHNICHATLELEKEGEGCSEPVCCVKSDSHSSHHHHHHHH